MNQNELAHYGVLGMKWGVRRTPAQLARARGEKVPAAKSQKESKAKSPSTKKKSFSEMSDDELKKEISRLQLEKTYKDLMRSVYPPKKSVSDYGKEIVTDILTNSAKNIGSQAVTYVMGKGVNKALSGIFDDPNVVNPKKGQKDK